MVGRSSLTESAPDKRKARMLSKLEIILCLMDGEKSGTELREHLSKSLQLEDRGNIKEQIGQLKQLGFIETRQEPHIKGPLPPVYYRLSDRCNSFDGLKELVQYISNHGNKENKRKRLQRDWILEIQKSQYYQNFINEKLFNDLSKTLVKTLIVLSRDIAQTDFATLKDNPKYSNLVREITQDPDLLEKYKKMKKWFKDADYEMYIEMNFDEEAKELSLFPLADIIQKILFPVKERNEILEILRCSPSALTLITCSFEDKLDFLFAFIHSYFRYYFQHIVSFAQRVGDEGEPGMDELLTRLIHFLDTMDRKSSSPF